MLKEVIEATNIQCDFRFNIYFRFSFRFVFENLFPFPFRFRFLIFVSVSFQFPIYFRFSFSFEKFLSFNSISFLNYITTIIAAYDSQDLIILVIVIKTNCYVFLFSHTVESTKTTK